MILRCFIGMVLLLAGGGIYRTISQQVEQKDSEVILAKSQCQSNSSPYWVQYRQWAALPLEEQFKNMWGENKYGTNATEQERFLGQQILLIANIKELASGEKEPGPFAQAIYGADWESRVNGFKDQQASNIKWQNYSFIIMAIGSLVIIASLSWGGFKHFRKSRKNSIDNQLTQETDSDIIIQKNTPQTEKIETTSQPKDKSIQLESGLGDYWTNKTDQTIKAVSRTENWERPAIQVRPEANNEAPAPSVITPSVTPQESFKSVIKEAKPPAPKEDGNLNKLAQEVTALREFAATQQNHVQKLQDGYDWTILKNFCLRIIRCIDNLETRIYKLENLGEDVDSLQDVCDEMIFALESSGVERYKPDINSAYKGQERLMEILKDRVDCEASEMEDKVAAVVRPGYQYVVDDDNIKIVRTAQVKLYKYNLVEAIL